jgi:carbonic anhydrase/acetyltransferase-like protein (isoleucine patch superfamily)
MSRLPRTVRLIVVAALLLGPLAASGAAAATSGAAAATSRQSSFVDSTVTVTHRANVHLGELVYVAPFARLLAGGRPGKSIFVGDESNIQDSVRVDAGGGTVRLGDQVLVAHGAEVLDGAELGTQGTCPAGEDPCPSFVGFNAQVDGAVIDKDSMVLTLARVGPGVHLPSGRKVLMGRNIISQAQVMAKTEPVTAADRAFMQGVLEVNVAFAKGYAQLRAEDPANVRGINYDPAGTDFNPGRDLPTMAGEPTRNPKFHNRIIGAVHLADDLRRLRRVMGRQDSLRADEGEPFEVGTIRSMGRQATFHALEHTEMQLGDGATYGPHSVVHGGPAFDATTRSGDDLKLAAWAVLFQSHVGDHVRIGAKSLVQSSDLADGTVVPDRTVIVGGLVVGTVEW